MFSAEKRKRQFSVWFGVLSLIKLCSKKVIVHQKAAMKAYTRKRGDEIYLVIEDGNSKKKIKNTNIPICIASANMAGLGISSLNIKHPLGIVDLSCNPLESIQISYIGSVEVVIISENVNKLDISDLIKGIVKVEQGSKLSTKDLYRFIESNIPTSYNKNALRKSVDSIKGVKRGKGKSVWENASIDKSVPFPIKIRSNQTKATSLILSDPINSVNPDTRVKPTGQIQEEICHIIDKCVVKSSDSKSLDNRSSDNESSEKDKRCSKVNTIDEEEDFVIIGKSKTKRQSVDNSIIDEIELELSTKKPRQSISKGVRQKVWERHFGEVFKGKCYMCDTIIKVMDPWHCSHIISSKHGGSIDVSNLVPCCADCNLRTSSVDIHERMYIEANDRLDINIKCLYELLYFCTSVCSENGVDDKHLSPKVSLDLRTKLIINNLRKNL